MCIYFFIIIIVTELFIYHYNRGTTFRKEFAELKVVRSLIPSGVNVMALTATATSTTRRSIIKMLGMEKPLKSGIYLCACITCSSITIQKLINNYNYFLSYEKQLPS